jgi:hypothetical protein
MWMFFLTFYKQYPELHVWLAIAAFFIPSVFFWGSGLLKDTITLGCLGIATYQIFNIFMNKSNSWQGWLLLLLSLYALYAIKIYILLTFLPAAILWIFISNLSNLRSLALQIMLFPLVISVAISLSYFAMLKAGEDNEKYSLGSLAKTAQVTAYDIRYWTGRDAGSGYTLGELDGTFSSMLQLGPQAINVTLFRPYLWEVSNSLMLLSALESFSLLCVCIYIFARLNFRLIRLIADRDIFFTLIFSLVFAFAVGVSTFNFGSLVRYKIPILPFFVVGLILMLHYSNKDRNLDVFDMTE